MRVSSCRVLPLRPRRIADAHHAAAVCQAAETDRGVLPRWGVRSPVRDHGAAPGAYTGSVGWRSREHWLTVTVPVALVVHQDVLARHHVEPSTFLRWARIKSLYAQEQRCGRTVIVRPDTLAGLLQCSLSTVHRCQRAARELGLELVVIPGRMLSEIECHRARRAGSPQRGLSTVSAFVVPAALPRPVCHDTPTRGRTSRSSVEDCFTIQTRSAGFKGAPLRSAPHQRKQRRAKPVGWELARELCVQAIWLRGCPPGRIAGQLSRYRTAALPWTATRLLRAMDGVNVRLGYSAPIRPKTAPWGLLAWYLAQIDPVADHPDYDGAFA